MTLNAWWSGRNLQKKVITVLATILLLDIGLCFGTPSLVDMSAVLFHFHSQDPYLSLGLMAWQAISCLILLVLIGCLAVFWHPDLRPARPTKDQHD